MSKGTINVSVDNIFPLIKKFLYSDHEIFLRELISNATDATLKLKHLTNIGEADGVEYSFGADANHARTDEETALFAKPHLDEMGTSGDHAVPAGKGSTLFRKNSLDEMTVRRTEKPVGGKPPARPPSSISRCSTRASRSTA